MIKYNYPLFSLSSLYFISFKYYSIDKFIPSEIKWKQRWDEVQCKIKDQKDISLDFGLNHPSINWFPGHMYKASKQMEEILSQSDISLVLEIRDARIPFSSSNPMIDNLLTDQKKKRIIVLNKSDLSDISLQKSIEEQLMEKENIIDVIHTNSREQRTMELLLNRSISIVKKLNSSQTVKIFIVGMPNVGKSSIINSFKRITGNHKVKQLNPSHQIFVDNYKEQYGSLPFTLMDTSINPITRKKSGGKKKNTFSQCKTGARAGVTRSIEQFIINKQNPRILCLDSPGIMMPKLYNYNQALRLAVVGSLRDELVGEELIGEYLLYHLNKNKCIDYLKLYSIKSSDKPLESYQIVLKEIAKSIGGLSKKGELNRNRAAKKFLTDYRKGKLGLLTLDIIENEEELIKT